MNPLTNTKNIIKLNEREITLGVSQNASWHNQYKDSAWVFIGGLPYDLTEGDVLCIFSQFGEVVNINLVRDKKTGKQKGFCFLCYEDQKSTVLAVDNLNGIKVLGRTIRVDHVASYKPPKDRDDYDDITKALHKEGCAPRIAAEETHSPKISEQKKGSKKAKKSKKKKNKEKRRSSSSDVSEVRIKEEKHKPGYDKYENPEPPRTQMKKERERYRSFTPDRRSPQVDRRKDNYRDRSRPRNISPKRRNDDGYDDRRRNPHVAEKQDRRSRERGSPLGSRNVRKADNVRRRRSSSSASSSSSHRTNRKRRVSPDGSPFARRHRRSRSRSRK